MAINFEEIPSDFETPLEPTDNPRTVLEEINARQHLLLERTIKCKDIKPLYEKPKKKPPHFAYRYFCICPRFKPQYVCRHKDNIIIDRDVLTQEEHIVHLATPKADFGAPRKMPRFIQKKYILPNCTARINKLAAPDLKQVNDTFNNFQHIISKRHKKSLQKHLQKSPNIEYTSIKNALAWMAEEKRLKKVAKRMKKLRCKKMAKKIERKLRSQIKKIICALFEEMKEFLLNDRFIMDESSPLVAVILENIKKFTDQEFHITSNLREYQKTLAFNLAIWINKFISNLNIHVCEEPPTHYAQMSQPQPERPTQELESFLPLDGYISASSSEEAYYEEEDEEQ